VEPEGRKVIIWRCSGIIEQMHVEIDWFGIEMPLVISYTHSETVCRGESAERFSFLHSLT
jgi:hypothetical protein